MGLQHYSFLQPLKCQSAHQLCRRFVKGVLAPRNFHSHAINLAFLIGLLRMEGGTQLVGWLEHRP